MSLTVVNLELGVGSEGYREEIAGGTGGFVWGPRQALISAVKSSGNAAGLIIQVRPVPTTRVVAINNM